MDRPFWSWTRGLCWWAAMWWTLGKYSTRIPLTLRQLCPKFCIVVIFWTNSIFLPKQHLMLGSDSPFQDITQKLKIRKPFACERLMTLSWLTKDKCFNEESSQWIGVTPKISSDCATINFPVLSNICFNVRLFPVFLMECFFFFFLVILSHEYRCFQFWRHKHSPN